MTTQDIMDEVREMFLRDEDPRLEIIGLFTPGNTNDVIYQGIKAVHSRGVSFKHLPDCPKLTPIVCVSYLNALRIIGPALVCEAVVVAAIEWCCMPQAREDSVKSLLDKFIPMADAVLEAEEDWMG